MTLLSHAMEDKVVIDGGGNNFCHNATGYGLYGGRSGLWGARGYGRGLGRVLGARRAQGAQRGRGLGGHGVMVVGWDNGNGTN